MINLITKYLRLSNYSTLTGDFKELYLSHPNFPSIYALTDSLDSMKIENVAVKLPKEQFFELPNYFLAQYSEEIVLVNKKHRKTITIEKENGKKTFITSNEFLENWDGIIVVIEPNVKEKRVFNNPFMFSWTLLASFTTLAIILFFIWYHEFKVTSFIYLLTSLTGLLLSILIFLEKLGVNNDFISKICNGFKTSCNEVVRSNSSQSKWLNFSDLPIIFFSINFLSIFIHPLTSSFYVGLFSFISIPLLSYSIWLQNAVIKKWCVLCLSIATIVLFQALYFIYTADFSNVSFPNGFIYFTIFSVVAFGWLSVRPLIETSQVSHKKIALLTRFKRNFELFKNLSKKVAAVEKLSSLQSIYVGLPSSKIQLRLFLSPSCGHCHTAFEDAYQLYLQYPNKVAVSIYFNINPDNLNNPYHEVVQNMVAINNYSKVSSLDCLRDWHIEKMKLEDWLLKWRIFPIDGFVHSQIAMQYDWCFSNNYNFTPLRIINNSIFPQDYSIAELRYFISDYEEEPIDDNLLLVSSLD